MDWVGGNNNNNSASVCYCCVWKDGGILYKYSIGNHEIDNMAALCLEAIPPYHRFFSETVAGYTFAFLIDGGFVYFAILRHNHGNSHLLSFLHNLRDDFTRISGRRTDFPAAVGALVASFGTAAAWPAMSSANGDGGAATSTKAPLLARHDRKKKKKKMDDGGDIESVEHRRSEGQVTATATMMMTTSASFKSNGRDKWCRQVRIILAIDAAVCIVLFVIWLVVCRGLECIR